MARPLLVDGPAPRVPYPVASRKLRVELGLLQPAAAVGFRPVGVSLVQPRTVLAQPLADLALVGDELAHSVGVGGVGARRLRARGGDVPVRDAQHRVAVERPVEHRAQEPRCPHVLLQPGVALSLGAAVVERHRDHAPGLEQRLVVHLGEVVGVDPQLELRAEGELVAEQVAGRHEVAARPLLHQRRVEGHVLRRLGALDEPHAVEPRHVGGSRLRVSPRLLQSLGLDGGPVVPEHREDGVEGGGLSCSGRPVGDVEALRRGVARERCADTHLEEGGHLAVAAESLR